MMMGECPESTLDALLKVTKRNSCGLQVVLRELLAPRQWKAPDDRRFFLDHEQISELCDAAEAIFKDEPSVLRLKGGSPACLVGDLVLPENLICGCRLAFLLLHQPKLEQQCNLGCPTGQSFKQGSSRLYL